VDLQAVFALFRVAGGRLLLDLKATVGEEGERAAIRRESGVSVVARPDRQSTRVAAVGIDGPDRVAIRVAGRRDRL
jgi:hypothetical protein